VVASDTNSDGRFAGATAAFIGRFRSAHSTRIQIGAVGLVALEQVFL